MYIMFLETRTICANERLFTTVGGSEYNDARSRVWSIHLSNLICAMSDDDDDDDGGGGGGGDDDDEDNRNVIID